MRPIAAMNVIPFIDIMLVLLAVVLTTATFVAQGRIPVSLPETENSQPVREPVAVELTISVAGEIFLDGERVSLAALESAIASLSPDTRIRLRVDADAAFEHFVSVIERLKTAGLENVSVVTRQKSE